MVTFGMGEGSYSKFRLPQNLKRSSRSGISSRVGYQFPRPGLSGNFGTDSRIRPGSVAENAPVTSVMFNTITFMYMIRGDRTYFRRGQE